MKRRRVFSAVDNSHRQKAVAYARVSSKEQEREGFSIPAQQQLVRDYAVGRGIEIAKEFVDVETAKYEGRTNFAAMVRYLKSHRDVRNIIVEKTDRLYRNLKDWVSISELGIEIHLVKENGVISESSRSSDKLVHGIMVLMAKNYVDNLSEEARKGMKAKAEQGYWPSSAPLGYRNVMGPNGKRIVEIDQQSGPIVFNLFNWYASGALSLEDLTAKGNAAGLVSRVQRKPLYKSTVHALLRNPFYMASSNGAGSIMLESTKRSSRAICGSGFSPSWMLGAPPKTNRAYTSSLIQG